MSKKVLIVSFHSPLSTLSIGSLRVRGLAKYLPEYNWEPVVLTVISPGEPDSRLRVIQTPYPGDVKSNIKQKLGLNPETPAGEQVTFLKKIYTKEDFIFLVKFATLIRKALTEILEYPDGQKRWYPLALDKGIKLLSSESFDAIISSSPPPTCHLIARDLKRKFKIPWVADLRDLWTQNHHFTGFSPIRRTIGRQLELKTLSLADALVTVSDPLAQKLRTLHKLKPVYTITNGFDPDEVKEKPITKEFSITYTGNIFTGRQNPEPLFRALSELIAENQIKRECVKIRFYAGWDYCSYCYHWVEKDIRKYNLEGVVSLYPKVPREIALDKQRESQILLLLNWTDPKERGIYTGKLFEYLAAKRPILAIGGPRSVVTELLEETRAGVHPLNYEELKKVLLEFYNEYKTYGYVPYKGNEEKISKYSHREMARRFADVLNTVTER
uniref:Glycosyltransferase subfamily 4-like N-terminal domain-containing protein n=1 Tax=candidate division WOR-3 bacterium TaxID=2052148 RepID=A0A7C2K557_UNCW3